MKVMALIPARKGSTRLPGKNMRTFGGKPLIAWSVDVAVRSWDFIDRVVVTSNDDDVLAYVDGRYRVNQIKRPEHLCRDDTPTEPVIAHALEHEAARDGYRPDAIMLLQPTSPLRTIDDVEAACKLMDSFEADAVISVSVSDRPWELGHANRMRRIKASPSSHGFVAENGVIFLVRADAFEREGLFPEKSYAYYIPSDRALDIDTRSDFEVAEAMLRQRMEVAA